MTKYLLNQALPSYSNDGINSRGYAKGDVIDVNDLHAAGLAAAGYFDIDSPVEDKEIKGAPEVSLGNAGLTPPFFNANDQLVVGGLRPGAADLVGHEARGVNDPENQPKTVLVPGEGERVVQPGGQNPDPDDGPTGTRGAVDDQNSSATDASNENNGDVDDTNQEHPNAHVRIPKNWNELGAADIRAVADRLEGEPTANKTEAVARVQAEVDRREAEKAAK